MIARALILFFLLAPPGLAQSMSAQAFDNYTRGKTLYYGSGGKTYGVQRYLAGHRVIWSFLDERCETAEWYGDNGQICFTYEGNTAPQCWSFTKGTNGLIARFRNDPKGTALYEAQDMDKKMLCYGADVGV